MKKLIVANWKENPKTERLALSLFSATARVKRRSGVQVIVCPPFIYLEAIVKKWRTLRSKSNLALGAQDVFWEKRGAYTGEVGPEMLRSLGMRYVIIGHSERRKFLRETDAMVNQKVHASLHAGLAVILCVGEPLAVRKKGIIAAKCFIQNQLTKDLRGIRSISRARGPRLIIAYEPIWAIGTGRNAKPADAVAMADFIKKTLLPKPHSLKPMVLYGGSVSNKNINDYLHSKSISGVLVGSASWKSKEFGQIIANS